MHFVIVRFSALVRGSYVLLDGKEGCLMLVQNHVWFLTLHFQKLQYLILAKYNCLRATQKLFGCSSRGDSFCMNSGQLVVGSANQESVHITVTCLYYPSEVLNSCHEVSMCIMLWLTIVCIKHLAVVLLLALKCQVSYFGTSLHT
jgi:hypothetical protein